MSKSFMDTFGFNTLNIENPLEEEQITSKEETAEEVEETSEEEASKKEAKEKVEEKPKEAATVSDSDSSPFSDIIQDLVNNDLLDFDEDKEYDISKIGLQDLIQETVEKKSLKAVETFKESLGEDGKTLIDMLSKGLTVNDYVAIKEQVDYSKVPLLDKKGQDIEQNQINLVYDYLKHVKELDEDEIQEELDSLIERGSLKKEAERSKDRLVKWREKTTQEYIKEKEREQEFIRKEQEVEADKFETKVKGLSDLQGFKLTKTEASELYDYITKADKEGKTKFQKEDSESNRLLYAYFAMKKFSKTKIETEVKTQQAIKLKKQLNNTSSIKGTIGKKSDFNQKLSDIKLW